jgi:hypothetical protein
VEANYYYGNSAGRMLFVIDFPASYMEKARNLPGSLEVNLSAVFMAQFNNSLCIFSTTENECLMRGTF